MATTEELRALLDESRNGCNNYIRHPLARRFIYTDGVKEVADLCGAYWLLDILATEAGPALVKQHDIDYSAISLIEVSVVPYNGVESQCRINLTVDDDQPAIWVKHLAFTDFPEGSWVFKLGLDRDSDGATVAVMCLLSED